MTEESFLTLTQTKLPLHGVIIFVSQQLASTRMILHQQCTELGGRFVWVFNVPFTHYVCKGKLSKRGKEYKKAEEYKASCVHPAWLTACHNFRQRVTEKLYASTYNPNRSLTFISVGDNDSDEENQIPSITTTKSTPLIKTIQTPRTMPIINKKKNLPPLTVSIPSIQISPPKVIATLPKPSSQISNEAETMLNDLESSLAQFLNNNNSNSTASISRPSIADDDQNRKSLAIIRSISNNNNNSGPDNIEPSMRIEWLDDAMQAERKKMKDEDEHGVNSQQKSQSGESKSALKRSLVDSNANSSFNSKKCRT